MKKPSMAKLANSIGIARSTLYTWREEGAPLEKGAMAVLSWAAKNSKELGDPKDVRAAMQVERLAILKASRARVERENQIAAKELMPCADACRQAAEAMALVFSDIIRDANELPPQLVGHNDPVAVYKILNGRIEKHRADWSEKFKSIGC